MQDRPAPRVGYQDPLVVIQDGLLVIRRYYVPTGAKGIRLVVIAGIPSSTGAPGGTGQRR
jgi:hypothetical protein